MANNVTVKFRDGTDKKFADNGRAGGSFQQTVEYADGYVKVIDVWGHITAYPNDLVREVNECPTHY